MVLVPADLEQQKIVMTAVFGGTLVTVEGTYDDVNRVASELAEEHEDWAFVNVNVRPYYAEGSKTLGFEVAEEARGGDLEAQTFRALRVVGAHVDVDEGPVLVLLRESDATRFTSSYVPFDRDQRPRRTPAVITIFLLLQVGRALSTTDRDPGPGRLQPQPRSPGCRSTE